jgi:F0F1-type ATP synthase delta subunit
MKTKEEIEQLANEWTNGIDESYKVLLKAVYIKGYTQCQEDIIKEPFNNFYSRLKKFVSNVKVNDMMSEEEKEMIICVCDKQLNKQD